MYCLTTEFLNSCSARGGVCALQSSSLDFCLFFYFTVLLPIGAKLLICWDGGVHCTVVGGYYQGRAYCTVLHIVDVCVF